MRSVSGAMLLCGGCSLFLDSSPQRDAGVPIDARADAQIREDCVTESGEPSLDGWTQRTEITLTPPFQNAAIFDYVAAISFSGDDRLMSAQPNGADIAFTDGECARLPHEIEIFDPATGALSAWVKLNLGPGPTVVFMHYGNGEAEPQADPSGTWPGFVKSTWHLSNQASTPPEYSDSAGANHITVDSMQPRVSAGVVGDAADLGMGARLTVPDNPTLSFGSGDFTISTWLLVTSSQVGAVDVLGKKVGSGSGFAISVGEEAPWRFSLTLTNAGGDQTYAVDFEPTGPVPIDQWVFLAAVVNRGLATTQAFLAGAPTDSRPLMDGTADNIGDLAVPRFMTTFSGGVDEPRIYDIALTPLWIEADAAFQRPDSTSIAFGPDEPQ